MTHNQLLTFPHIQIKDGGKSGRLTAWLTWTKERWDTDDSIPSSQFGWELSHSNRIKVLYRRDLDTKIWRAVKIWDNPISVLQLIRETASFIAAYESPNSLLVEIQPMLYLVAAKPKK